MQRNCGGGACMSYSENFYDKSDSQQDGKLFTSQTEGRYGRCQAGIHHVVVMEPQYLS